MVSTRSMAGKSIPAPDKENDQQLNLRKKPVRRATAKASTTKPTKKPDDKDEPKLQPLSPKKITQVAKAKTIRTIPEPKKKPTVAQPKRPVRKAAVVAQKAAPRTRRTAPVIVEADEPADEPEPVAKPDRSAEEEEQVPSDHGETINHSIAEIDDARSATEKDEEEHEPVHSTPVSTRRTRNRKAHSTPEPAQPVHEDDPTTDDTAPEEELVLPSVKTPKTSHGKTRIRKATKASRNARRSKIEREDSHTSSEDELCGSATGRLENGSDDELCGPKTPMRRGSPMKKPTTSVKKSALSLYALKTPARRLRVLGHAHGTPQTQKVPMKPLAPDTVQRPMTVARGSSASYVFQPLPKSKATQALSPMHAPPSLGDYFSIDSVAAFPEPEDDEEDIEDTIIPVTVDEKANETEILQSSPAHTSFIDRTVSPRRAQESAPVESDSEQEEEDEELAESDEDMTLQKDAAYTPIELSDESEDDADENAVTMIAEQPDSWRRLEVLEDIEDESQNAPEPTLNIESVDDEEGETVQPDFPSELFASSPEQMAPTRREDVDSDESGVASSPIPRTPVSIFKPRHTDIVTGTNDSTPVTGLSLPAGGSRLSFPSATAKLLQTPHMRSFEELALTEEAAEPTEDAIEVAELTVCIDPALLSLPTPEAVPSASLGAVDETTISKSIHRHEQIPDIDMDLSMPDIQATPTMTRLFAEETVVPETGLDVQEHGTADAAVRELQSAAPEPSAAVTVDQTKETESKISPEQIPQSPPNVIDDEEERHEVETETLSPIPHYARNTIAYDARRKSMPVGAVSTPKSTLRPRTADTVIKPITSDAFAQLWAARSRRYSTQAPPTPAVVPARSLCSTPLPTRTRKSSQTPAASSTQRLPPPSAQRNSFLRIQHATPTSHTGPRPRAYTPTISSTRTPTALKTPIKTPLKPPALTPGSYAMTPHPAQPLKGLTCIVEVFTLEGASASSPFIALLHRLGARTTKTWSERVTHVVFKDGSPTTLQRVRLANKDAGAVRASPKKATREVFCVNSRWVTDCDRLGARVDERGDEYAVDVSEVPRAGRRRRKSMEPASLRNLDGNVVKAPVLTPGRKGKAARDVPRLSVASSVWEPSPVKGGATEGAMRDEDEENTFWDPDASFLGTPTTATATPGTVRGWKGQQTAPVNRVRKLRLGDDKGGRRLTFWPGGKSEQEMED